MGEKKVQVDGMLREWPGEFFKLKTKAGASSPNSALVGYDDDFLYVAAKIGDGSLARSKSAGKKEDHLSLSIYFPQAGGSGRSNLVDIYPGDPKQKLAAVVKVNGRAIQSASAVEAPREGGFTLEARIPWSGVQATGVLRLGMRGKLQYFDTARVGGSPSVTSYGTGAARAMPPLTTESETGLIQALLEPKGLKFAPDKEVYGDLTGAGGKEKVALYGHFLSILGPGYKDGKQFYFNELDVARPDQVTRLSLLDVNGDGRDEILLQKRLGTPEKFREVLQILRLGRDGAPLQVFAHEIALVTPDGQVTNKVTIIGKGKDARVKISQGLEQGFEPGTFAEPLIGGGIEPALLPWDEISSKTYGWKGEGLTLLDKSDWKPAKANPLATRTTSTGRAAAPPPPRPPTTEELLSRVYGLYKADRKVHKNQRPTFDFVTDVVGDSQMERVLVHDRDLVVFGKGFKRGLSYTYLTIGVKEAKDILAVTTRDLVGDGKAEVLVHAVINAQASKSLGGDIVARQALFIYKVEGETLTRIFAAETGRSLKGNRILASLAFVPNGARYDLQLRPLRALGWTEQTYPFPEDQHPAGGLEPLLLPWSSVGARSYAFDGSTYVQK